MTWNQALRWRIDTLTLAYLGTYRPSTGPPAFDPYTVGSLRQIDRVVRGPNRAKVSRPQGWIRPRSWSTAASRASGKTVR